MINRRGFIGGLIASVAGSEALIKLASPAEAKLLGAGDRALLPPIPYGLKELPRRQGLLQPGEAYMAVSNGNGVGYEVFGWLRNWSLNAKVDSLVDMDFDIAGNQYRQIGAPTCPTCGQATARRHETHVTIIPDFQRGNLP